MQKHLGWASQQAMLDIKEARASGASWMADVLSAEQCKGVQACVKQSLD